MMQNLVALPPSGLVIALGYWAGDRDQAMRLARLIGAIEPRRRDDVSFAFCPRFDLEWDVAQQAAFLEVGRKFGVCRLTQLPPHATGHPDACNAMVASTLFQFAQAWRAGQSRAHSVFLCEPDGVPLRRDWINVLKDEHERTMRAGRSVTGPWVEHPVPHLNGSMIIHLATWFDCPSIHETPAGHAWDLHHAHALAARGRASGALKNIYGGRDWSDYALTGMARETAWMASVKDDSAIAWAERTLVERPAAPATPPLNGRRVTVHG